jgi:hypothetical protein
MKKFGKFLFGTVAIASIAAGAYYFYKNFIKKDSTDDFDDFEDDFEDFDSEEDSESESREYVPINMSGEANKTQDKADNTSESEEEEDLPADEE